jgi:uncharacterized protein (TIGR01244 family)
MTRALVALMCGALFGAGLLVSGMTDTLKVQGWLDVFGQWDATLAFVMGGAIVPMAVAWRLAARRKLSILGLALPDPPRREVGSDLVTGSVLFGMGWALAGLCPGPALASVSFGGAGGLVFLLAMTAGMVLSPAIRARMYAPTPSQLSPSRSTMDIRALTPDYAVSPQIDLADLAVIKAAGFTTVIDNRPDGEIPPPLHGPAMKAAAEALGLTFVINPVLPGNFSDTVLQTQRAAVEAATGPVFAYCASGNRCSCVWALMLAGQRPADELIAIPARFGYNLEPLRDRIEAAAR